MADVVSARSTGGLTQRRARILQMKAGKYWGEIDSTQHLQSARTGSRWSPSRHRVIPPRSARLSQTHCVASMVTINPGAPKIRQFTHTSVENLYATTILIPARATRRANQLQFNCAHARSGRSTHRLSGANNTLTQQK